MGRAKRFDPNEVLDRAVRQFWRHGYAATTMRDLETAMGLGTASLYNAFGDKRTLFRQSLRRYLDTTSRQRAACIRQSTQPRSAIEAFLSDILALSEESRDGCLLVNSAAEVAAHDAELRADIETGLREVEDALAEAIVRGQSEGSIGGHLDASTLARSLLGSVIAMRVLARTGMERGRLGALVEAQCALIAPAALAAGRAS